MRFSPATAHRSICPALEVGGVEWLRDDGQNARIEILTGVRAAIAPSQARPLTPRRATTLEVRAL
ncbi:MULTISPECIES: hypothetical protein [unclassified Methylobacterium]|uniref:hypothetical protein n=1 Tax=unclassified Methylobacterium TaxID=2615210 RepID=UPI0011C204B8|nr:MULTISPECIES: hypothetical protein [unclassified Methylobacterium]QEE37748.1 hypothetical protein FVA80_01040 [Methylobacterium sp. WL1]TXN54082.1 hypothetical protein FV241_25535 [Methylobacterium sp. WL2]